MRFPPDSCSQFHKHFMHSILVIYGSNKISCTIINCMHASMLHFPNALAYFASTISYADTMTMLIKDFTYNDFIFNDFTFIDLTYNNLTSNNFTYNNFTYNNFTYNIFTFNNFTYKQLY